MNIRFYFFIVLIIFIFFSCKSKKDEEEILKGISISEDYYNDLSFIDRKVVKNIFNVNKLKIFDFGKIFDTFL